MYNILSQSWRELDQEDPEHHEGRVNIFEAPDVTKHGAILGHVAQGCV